MTKNSSHKVTAKQVAIGYLSRRDHAEMELRIKLQGKHYGQDEIDSAITDCLEHGWLNDHRYTSLIVRNSIAKGLGELRLREELKKKGISEAIINLVFEECDVDWFEHAKDVALRKFGISDADTLKEKAKRYRFMEYRGFDSDQISYALNIRDDE
ncbi:recombination regulator RecX [Photobacterium profundum]|uniref:Regulatory protein RecX n=1 Tax=Photobacterium profundum 3TCK TaxID=314280 RepID=Q1Z484_9GAMM|nr:recombination regulator RecX [Photobacterium profundum]EAS43465.1 RecA regulator RecX [Photobacterium profundum 3TCK]PSV59950.1 recombination regulator RecX [Photobacterium profundum]